MEPASITLREAIEQFIDVKVEEGRKETTTKGYKSRLMTVLRPLLPEPIKGITRDQIVEAMAVADARNNNSTQTLTRGVLSSFQTWLLEEEIVEKPLVKKSDLKSRGVRMRTEFINEAQIEQICRLANRSFVILFRALLATGARPIELVSAQIEQLQKFEAGYILELEHHKTEKTGRKRLIAIDEHGKPWFDEAIGERTTGHIFRKASGEPWKREQVTDMFRRLRNKTDIPKNIKFYSARHRYATLRAKSQPLQEVAALLGHSPGSKMVERYVQWRGSDLLEMAIGEPSKRAA